MALTVNVLLSSGTFEGGGTAFWREDSVTDSLFRKAGHAQYEDGSTDAPTLSVQPAGAGVGVLFNGSVKHAGRAVTSGVRHVLVASFSIRDGLPTE